MTTENETLKGRKEEEDREGERERERNDEHDGRRFINICNNA